MDSDLKPPASRDLPLKEIYCPQCQGGNPPQAVHCMWCGYPLAGSGGPDTVGVETSSSLSSPPIPPPSVQMSSGPKQPRWVLLVGAVVGLLLVCAVCGIISSISNSRNTAGGTPNTRQTQPVSASTTPDSTMVAAATETAVVNMAGTLPGAGDKYLYASETYHSVSVFAPVYLELGGAASLGFPITEMFIERRPDGKAYWVQYFEKAVIEYHPEETGSNSYQLAPLGVWRFNEKYPQGAPPAKSLPGPGQYHFNETNHTVTDPFLTYWKEHGQVRRFGYPISESFEEVSEVDGKTYTVQYFERAVMEYHPELKPPHQVQLTALGTLRHRALYPNGAPMAASQPIPSPTVNATATARAIANATATAEARAASARATARVREYESYKTSPPKGTFSNRGSNVAIACEIEYQQCVGYWCANKNSKYILVGVTVENIGNDTVHVNPYNFTLVSTTGATVAHATATYALGNYLDAVDIEPGTYTSGWIAFLTTKDFIPGELIWSKIFGEKVIVTIVEPPD